MIIRRARKSDFPFVYPILKQIFDEMNIDKNIRAEKLTLKQFMILTDNLMKVNLLS